MSAGAVNLTIMLAYMIGVLAIGYWAWRRSVPGREDFFLARRGFGTVVLLAAVFGTNMTAFVMVGAPGIAYHAGYSLLGYAAGGGALMLPLSLYLVGYRLWLLGKRYGYLTPGEIFGDRWNSRAVKWVLFVLWIAYVIPYIQLGVVGGGRVLSVLSEGIISYELGCIIPMAIVFIYVFTGGMRGTGWTNVFQTFVFMAMLAATFFIVAYAMGGFRGATAALEPPKLALVGMGPFVWQKWLSFSFLVCGWVGLLIHVMLRVMSSVSDRAIKRTILFYPLCLTLVWMTAVHLGTWGSAAIPGLVGAESDNILPMMLMKFAPAAVIGILGAGMLAAIMSSTDAMSLTISTIVTRDVVKEVNPKVKEATEVNLGRWLVLAVCVVAVILGITNPMGIIRLGEISFSGFVCMGPAILGGLWWKRTTKWGALAALVVPAIMLPIYFFGPLGASNVATLGGFLPIFPCLLVGIVLVIVVSLLTPRPPQDKVEKWWDGCFKKLKD